MIIDTEEEPPNLDETVRQSNIELQTENRNLHAIVTSLHEKNQSINLKFAELQDKVSSTETANAELKNRIEDLEYELSKTKHREEKLETNLAETLQKLKSYNLDETCDTRAPVSSVTQAKVCYYNKSYLTFPFY